MLMLRGAAMCLWCAASAVDSREGTRHMFPSSGPLVGNTALKFRVDMPDGPDAVYTATFAGRPQRWPLTLTTGRDNLLELAATPPHATHEAVIVEVRDSGPPSQAGRAPSDAPSDAFQAPRAMRRLRLGRRRPRCAFSHRHAAGTQRPLNTHTHTHTHTQVPPLERN